MIPLIILSCSGAASASVKKDADDVFTYVPSVTAADVVTRTNFNRPLFITSAST
ncbi:serine protease [Cronobacter turicensis 564]|nr:serine protease [Cronobacter turicensis 564]